MDHGVLLVGGGVVTIGYLHLFVIGNPLLQRLMISSVAGLPRLVRRLASVGMRGEVK